MKMMIKKNITEVGGGGDVVVSSEFYEVFYGLFFDEFVGGFEHGD